MKKNRIFVFVTEFCCVAILALCGATALANSGLYGSLEKVLSGRLPPAYLTLVIFLVILALGVFFIVVKNKHGGVITIVVAIMCLPSILAFNNIDLLRIFGSNVAITTKLTLVQMISIASLIVCAYFLLDLTHQLKFNLIRYSQNQAPPADIRDVIKHQHLLAIILTGAALAFSLIITGVARGFEWLLTRHQWPLSWWIVPIALFCFVVLGVYLYWVTTRKNEGQ